MKLLIYGGLVVSAGLIGVAPLSAQGARVGVAASPAEASQTDSSAVDPKAADSKAADHPTLPPPTLTSMPPQPVIPNSYQVNPGDELEVYVWGDERLQRTVRVLPDGTMSFPLVGQIMAQGRRLPELEAIVSARLAAQYRGQVPQVTVSVKAPTGMQFSVMGKIKSPGTFTPGRYVNILEALSLAGGPADFANLDNVLIIHNTGGGVKTERLKLGNLFRSGGAGSIDDTAIKRIQPGDTVIVP